MRLLYDPVAFGPKKIDYRYFSSNKTLDFRPGPGKERGIGSKGFICKTPDFFDC